jgi:hypothetical protein
MPIRIVSASLYANTGTGIGPEFSLEGRLIKTGTISWEVDDTDGVFLVKPSDLTCEIDDFDGAVWSYLESLRSEGALLPPWLVVNLEGRQEWLGLVAPDRCRRVEVEGTVEIWAADWSTQLGDKLLEGSQWERQAPLAIQGRPEEVLTAYSYLFGAYASGGAPRDQVYLHESTGQFSQGDFVTSPDRPGRRFRVMTIGEMKDEPLAALITGVPGRYAPVTLYGWDWLEGAYAVSAAARRTTLVREATSTTSSTAWLLRTATTDDREHPNYEMYFDVPVAGVVPGDKLRLIDPVQSAAYTVVDLDPESNGVRVKEPTAAHPEGARFYWDEDSAQMLVHEDARALLHRACSGVCTPDLEGFMPACLAEPVLAFLPLRPLKGDALFGPTRVEAGTDRLRVYSGGQVFEGTPEQGWTAGTSTTQMADWTCQMVRPPTSFMPDDSQALLMEFPGGFIGGWMLAAPEATVLHDYLEGKRHLVDGPTSTWREWTWSGSAWGPQVDRTWPGGHIPRVLAAFPGRPGDLLALTTDHYLQLHSGPSLALDAKLAEAVSLCTTPWGAYLVGGRGYGRVVLEGAGLRLDWQDVIQDGDGQLHPSTFVGLDQQRVVVLATITGPDPQDRSKVATVTVCLQMKAWPVPAETAAEAVLATDLVLDGAPRHFGIVRDPSRPGRVVGHVGGALWQVARELPPTVERIQALGMTALELIEAVCSLHNLVAIPGPDGVLRVISRMAPETPVDLLVDIEKQVEELSHPWYSAVVVSGEDDLTYEAKGAAGGKTLTLSQHPCAQSASQRKGMAMGLAQYFGVPRKAFQVTLFHSDATTAAPWEGLPRWALVTLNGAAPTYRVRRAALDLNDGAATLSLVEAGGVAYGYGAF